MGTAIGVFPFVALGPGLTIGAQRVYSVVGALVLSARTPIPLCRWPISRLLRAADAWSDSSIIRWVFVKTYRRLAL
jgi:hypothetical protein